MRSGRVPLSRETAVGLALLVAAVAAHAQDDAAPEIDDVGDVPAAPAVVVHGDRITGSFQSTDPSTIVTAIAEAVGADVVGGIQGADALSIDLEDVPIDRALERALGGQSFTIVYGADGSVRRIRLHGVPQEAPAPGSGVVRAAPAAAGGGAVPPHQLFDVEVPIPSVGPLAEHFGSDTATLGQLYRVAIDEEQAALRIAAVDAGMAAIEGDANLQGSIDSVLTGADDATLAGLVRTSAGPRANELVSRILSRTRRPEVRQRAVTVLRQLRQPTS